MILTLTLAILGAILGTLLMFAVRAEGQRAADAAYYKGLYEGEKGRREAAERQAAHGVALEPQGRELTAVTPPSEELARELGKPFSDETLTRGMEDLRKQFEAAGMHVTDAQLRAEAELMLGAAESDEPT